MTWNDFHRRADVLHAVIDAADARRDGVLPMDLPGVAETFGDDLDLVGALSLKWHARLSGNIERELAEEPMDPADAIARAWATTATEAPGLRAVLDRCTDHPTDARMGEAMNRMRTKERLRLAGAAGVASDESAASVRAGELIERRGRAAVAVSAVPEVEPGTPCLADRIKAVLAA